VPKKTTEKKAQNGSVPIEAIPHLYNQRMLTWQQAQSQLLQAILEELRKLNGEK
jgi:hypothetical protein